VRELQIVADSTDGSKRQRGRRGLDMLQAHAIQHRHPGADRLRRLSLHPRSGPEACLSWPRSGKPRWSPTTSNLNKVPIWHRVEVLNINDLANALKPVVLPGEKMMVLILKEGQGVQPGRGLLDDGTMVVVDHARKR